MFPCWGKIQFLVNKETILQELDKVKNEINLLQMDVLERGTNDIFCSSVRMG